MKKYIIDVVETYKRSVEIEAETEDEAQDIVAEKINAGDIPCDGGGYDYGCELFVSEVEESEV